MRPHNSQTWARIVMSGMVAGGIAWAVAPVWAGPPAESLKTTIDEVIRILEDQNWKKPEKKQERRKMLEQVIGQRFNYAEMAKRTLGGEWAKRTPEEQKDFVADFQTLLANTYIGRIEAYSGEKVQYLKEIHSDDFAEVRTKVDNGKSVIDIDYRLLMNGSGDWRVYDVVVEGTSLVQNYREQFKRILNKDSFQDLAKQLRKKTETIKAP
jgi:phospholipid transport system substrate-binding protein